VLGFLQRDAPGVGLVYMPGATTPSVDAFAFLLDRGIKVRELPSGDAPWTIRLRHPDWGEATVAGVVAPPPVDDLIRYAANLSDAERANASGRRPPCPSQSQRGEGVCFATASSCSGSWMR
jgi:hypothetical protein